MKNFLFLAIFGLISIAGFGQRIEVFKTSTGVPQDTVTNTGNKVLVSSNAPQFYDTVALMVSIQRISGTAAGSVIIQGSLDGVVNGAWANIDTVAVTNVASQSHIVVLDQYPYAYLRASYTGSGTMVAVLRTRGLYKRRGL